MSQGRDFLRGPTEKYSLRVNRSLLNEIERLAIESDRSVPKYIAMVLRAHVEEVARHSPPARGRARSGAQLLADKARVDRELDGGDD